MFSSSLHKCVLSERLLRCLTSLITLLLHVLSCKGRLFFAIGHVLILSSVLGGPNFLTCAGVAAVCVNSAAGVLESPQ